MIPITRIPGVYGEFNFSMANRSLPSGRRKVMLIGQRLKALIEPARFQGGTLNDASSSGAFSGNAKKDFIVQISLAAATDKFKYSTDGGATWSAETALAAGPQALEDGVEINFAATTGHAAGDEWRFSAWPEPTVAANMPHQLASDTEAAIMSGYGSIAHAMALAALGASKYIDLNSVELDEAVGAVAAAGSGTVTGPATASGTLEAFINGVRIAAGYAKGDTESEIALALQAEMEKRSDLIVFFAVDAATPAKVNFTARCKGGLGNQIKIGYRVTPNTGVGFTVVAMAGGATDPDVSTAHAAIFGERYHFIATAFNDQTSLEALRDHLDEVSGPVEQRPGYGVWSMSDDYATVSSMSGVLNPRRLSNGWLYQDTDTLRQYAPFETAAAFAATCAAHVDSYGPGTPLNGEEVGGVPAPAISNRLSRAQIENALWNGVCPLKVGPGEKVQIVRVITAYTKDGQGMDDPTLLDATKVWTMDYVREAINAMIARKYRKSKNTQSTRAAIDLDIYNELKKLEAPDVELVQDVDANRGLIKAEPDATVATQVNIKIPAAIVEGLHVIGIEYFVLAAQLG